MIVNYGTRTAKFISKLVQLTQEGELRWKTSNPGSSDNYPSFKAKLANRDLLLTCHVEKANIGNAVIGNILGQSFRTVVLHIGPSADAEATKLVNASGAGDLYDSVFRIVGGLDTLFDEVLK